ncbi:MAG TPA: hypothetical protein VJX67_06935, partial [Blastocatellia bacterium]|nr:hypothetical protein [Blastocatellia bacterium]
IRLVEVESGNPLEQDTRFVEAESGNLLARGIHLVEVELGIPLVEAVDPVARLADSRLEFAELGVDIRREVADPEGSYQA